MGAADDWQAQLVGHLADVEGDLFNPRRTHWDPEWRQSANDPHFREQVVWELDYMERADWIAMWLSPGTRSPVSLIELGLWLRSGKIVVGCPEGYWRKGNVDLVSQRFGVRVIEEWSAFVACVKDCLRASHAQRK